MTSDRQFARKAARRIVSIELEPHNHAIVRNISEGGLGFHALNPVTQTGTIRFSFSHCGERIEASGELVWLDSMKMTGGLRFASVPPSTFERLQDLVDPPVAAKSAVKAVENVEAPPDLAAANSGEPPPADESAIPISAPPAPAVPSPALPSPAPKLPYQFVLLQDEPGAVEDAWTREMGLPSSRTKLLRGIVIGASLAVVVAAIVFVAFGSRINAVIAGLRSYVDATRPPVVSPEPQVPAKPEPPPAVSSGSQVPANMAPPVATTAPESSADAELNEIPAIPATKKPHAPAESAQPRGKAAAKSEDSGDEDVALAQRYLSAKAGPDGDTIAASILWSAVEKGNLKAEIKLADLYARGDGVMKNCDQAQVLLRAAVDKGSNEASEALAQILRNGCHW